MAKYLIKASYSPEGIKGVMAKGGTARAEAIEKLATGVGGTVDGVYFSFGSDDPRRPVRPRKRSASRRVRRRWKLRCAHRGSSSARA